MKALPFLAIFVLISCISCNKPGEDTPPYNMSCPANPEPLRVYLRYGAVLPTGFTPNGDGRNDMLRFLMNDSLAIRSADVRIIDSAGKVVHTMNKPVPGWDGVNAATGKICAGGTYRVEYNLVMNGYGLRPDSSISGHTCIWLFGPHPSIPGCPYAKDPSVLNAMKFEDQFDPVTLYAPYTTGENFCP